MTWCGTCRGHHDPDDKHWPEFIEVDAADLAILLREVVGDQKYGADVDYPIARLRAALDAGPQPLWLD